MKSNLPPHSTPPATHKTAHPQATKWPTPAQSHMATNPTKSPTNPTANTQSPAGQTTNPACRIPATTTCIYPRTHPVGPAQFSPLSATWTPCPVEQWTRPPAAGILSGPHAPTPSSPRNIASPRRRQPCLIPAASTLPSPSCIPSRRTDILLSGMMSRSRRRWWGMGRGISGLWVIRLILRRSGDGGICPSLLRIFCGLGSMSILIILIPVRRISRCLWRGRGFRSVRWVLLWLGTGNWLYGLLMLWLDRLVTGLSMLGDDNFLRCGTKCAVVRIRSLNDSRLLVMSMSTFPLLVTRVRWTCIWGFDFDYGLIFLFLFILQRYTAFATSAFYLLYDWEAFILYLPTIYESRGRIRRAW